MIRPLIPLVCLLLVACAAELLRRAPLPPLGTRVNVSAISALATFTVATRTCAESFNRKIEERIAEYSGSTSKHRSIRRAGSFSEDEWCVRHTSVSSYEATADDLSSIRSLLREDSYLAALVSFDWFLADPAAQGPVGKDQSLTRARRPAHVRGSAPNELGVEEYVCPLMDSNFIPKGSQ